MQLAVNSNLPAGLVERQRAALMTLLGDDDPKVYQLVRTKILSFGPTACDWLRPHTLSSDPIVRRRCQEIVNRLARSRGDDQFLDFCLHHGEEFDLEKAVFLLARTQYPEVNAEAYQALFDHWADELRGRLDLRAPAEAILRGLNDYFFHVLRFRGEAFYGDNPENGYLSRVVDRRAGNPISLCAIYLLVARRLRLPVAGIGLPGHFICRYQSSTGEVYVDVFRRGRFWTKAECVRFLLQHSQALQEGYLAPVTPRRMVLRMCANLHQTYSQLEMTEEVTRLQRYLVALAR
jgi:regulator of sirC expression with transglutaminase-like and TPR domain